MNAVLLPVAKPFFAVVESFYQIGTVNGASLYLLKDNWDDFHFRVLYSLYSLTADGEPLEIGSLKIGQKGMGDAGSTVLPSKFQILDEDYFSLGQDASYYEQLYKVGERFASNALRGLRDVALDKQLHAEVQEEPVFKVALMRYVSQFELEGQLRRAATGEDRFRRYDFSYTPPAQSGRDFDSTELTFNVVPGSMPPTNVQAVIGRNGAGKTRLLNNMVRSLLDADLDPQAARAFDGGDDVLLFGRLFANLVSVTFSAFDAFDPRLSDTGRNRGIEYHYVGLKASQQESATSSEGIRTKTSAELSQDFAESFMACREKPRRSRWLAAMSALKRDPGFAEAGLDQLMSSIFMPTLETALAVFDAMSSGHKVVTLTMTRLVETVEERTLILIDEPESHLHPSLLASYMRALSELLEERNAVAIIATHSPVVLQEIPRSCVVRIRKSGTETVIDRITRQSFGENVGVLTDEVFGLQIEASGFHDLVDQVSRSAHTFEQAEHSFHEGLGGEARAILQAMMASDQTRD